jgi:electron transport complex protein RnfC
MEPGDRATSRAVAGDFQPLPEALRRHRPLLHVREPTLVPGAVPIRLLGGRLTHAVAAGDDPGAAPPAGDPLTLDAIRTLARDDLLQWTDRLRAAGVSADRRGSPDFSAQLDQVARRPIDVVVCNALDVDPTTTLQADWAVRQVESLYAGLLLLTRVSGASRCMVVVDSRAGARVAFDRPAGSRGVLEPTVRRVRNVYPLADPTVLLYELLERRLRPGRLPTLVGVLMVDAVAAAAVGRLALAGEAPAHVPFEIVDHRHARRRSLLVPIGARVADVLPAATFSPAPADLLAGAVLRDERAAGDDVIGPGELLLHLLPPAGPVEAEPCVRSGWCYDVCPVLAHPAGLLEAAQRRDEDLAERFGLEACVECGLCSQVCPSRLPLLQSIRSLRAHAPGDG